MVCTIFELIGPTFRKIFEITQIRQPNKSCHENGLIKTIPMTSNLIKWMAIFCQQRFKRGCFQVEELLGWSFLHFKMINYWYSCWLSKLWTHGVPPIFTTDLQCFVLVPTVTNYETDSTWCDNNTSRSGLPAKVAEGNKWMYFFKEPKTYSLFPLAAILINE